MTPRAMLFITAVVATLAHAALALAVDPPSRIAQPDPVLAARLPDALAAVERARTSAAADKHADAIRDYRRAIAMYPPIESEIARELGHQYTWNDQPDSARIWYTKQLGYTPNDVESKLGLARLEKWDDDQEGAIRLYNEAMRSQPRDLDTRLGRVQAVNWASCHRIAAKTYRRILKAHPGNVEAREGLARSYYWMGAPDSARAVIADGERTPGLASLEREMNDARAFRVSYTYDQNEDSDEIERRRHIVRAGVGLDDWTRLSGEYAHTTLEQPARPEVARDAMAVILERRFNATAMLNVTPGWQWNDYDTGSFDLFTLDAYLTLTPTDWVRMDLGVYHSGLDNPDAIFNEISVTTLSASVDWRLNTTVMWGNALDYSWYSDDNSRVGGETRLVWQPLWRLPIGVRNRLTSTTGFGAYGFSETNDNGYYDPQQYLSLYEELGIDLTFSSRVRARVAGRYGLDKENGDDWFDVGRFEMSTNIGLTRRLALNLGYYNSDSQLDSREGYAADGFWATLEYSHLRGDD